MEPGETHLYLFFEIPGIQGHGRHTDSRTVIMVFLGFEAPPWSEGVVSDCGFSFLTLTNLPTMSREQPTIITKARMMVLHGRISQVLKQLDISIHEAGIKPGTIYEAFR